MCLGFVEKSISDGFHSDRISPADLDDWLDVDDWFASDLTNPEKEGPTLREFIRTIKAPTSERDFPKPKKPKKRRKPPASKIPFSLDASKLDKEDLSVARELDSLGVSPSNFSVTYETESLDLSFEVTLKDGSTLFINKSSVDDLWYLESQISSDKISTPQSMEGLDELASEDVINVLRKYRLELQ